MLAIGRFSADPRSLLRPLTGCALFLLLAPLLSACGGGSNGGAEAGSADSAGKDKLEGAAVQPARGKTVNGLVRFEGCVVDETYLSSEDVPIRALDIDGRLLANARSDRRGQFALRVPAGIEMAVTVDRDGGDVLKVRGLDRDSAMRLCLVARPDEGEDDDRRTH